MGAEETKTITWMDARDIIKLGITPWANHSRLYEMARNFAIPHWRPNGNRKRGFLFPKEIIEAWLRGERIPDHYLMGRLATDVPPQPEAVEAVQARRQAAVDEVEAHRETAA